MSIITENKKTETMQIILTQRYAYEFLTLDENGKSFRAIIQRLALIKQSKNRIASVLPEKKLLGSLGAMRESLAIPIRSVFSVFFAERNGWLIIPKES